MKLSNEIRKCILRHMNVLEPCYRCKGQEEYNKNIQYRKRCSVYKDSEQWLFESN